MFIKKAHFLEQAFNVESKTTADSPKEELSVVVLIKNKV